MAVLMALKRYQLQTLQSAQVIFRFSCTVTDFSRNLSRNSIHTIQVSASIDKLAVYERCSLYVDSLCSAARRDLCGFY